MTQPNQTAADYEREVGGVEDELSILCHLKSNPRPDLVTDKAKAPRVALTPEQELICDHATD